MANPPKNVAASVRARLLTLSKERNQPFDLLLTRYVLERLLYRLGSTDYRNRFVLKGAMLLATWVDNQFRPTRDIDLLGSGNPDPDALLAIFKEIAAVDAADAAKEVFADVALAVPLRDFLTTTAYDRLP